MKEEGFDNPVRLYTGGGRWLVFEFKDWIKHNDEMNDQVVMDGYFKYIHWNT